MFSIDELTIIEIYCSQVSNPSRADVLSVIKAVLPFVGSEIKPIMETTCSKLSTITDKNFEDIKFLNSVF